MYYPIRNKESGFTLIELLIAMTIGMVVLGAMSNLFVTQRQSYDSQEQISDMVQTARTAIDIMSREIRMAGYNPSNAAFDGIPYSSTQLQIKADITDDTDTGASDGDTNDSNENIVYTYYDKDSDEYPCQIKRKTGNGYFQPFAENIDAFGVVYQDKDGDTTTTTSDIRRIQITITARTAKPDSNYPQNNGYRQYTLTSVVTPRNLAY